jgi:hypothetical protein
VKSLDELIAYHSKMEAQYREEADRALAFPDEGLAKRAHRQWTETWKVSRDTVSWLKAIRNRGLKT